MRVRVRVRVRVKVRVRGEGERRVPHLLARLVVPATTRAPAEPEDALGSVRDGGEGLEAHLGHLDPLARQVEQRPQLLAVALARAAPHLQVAQQRLGLLGRVGATEGVRGDVRGAIEV